MVGEGGVSRPESQGFSFVLHTIPLLAATCLAGFMVLQLLFTTGSW